MNLFLLRRSGRFLEQSPSRSCLALASAGLFSAETAATIAERDPAVTVHPLEEYRDALAYELAYARGVVRRLLELQQELGEPPAGR